MKVRVLFFSVLRDITGTDEVEWELPAAASSLADLLGEIEARWPRLRDWAGSMLLAVDQSYVRRDAATLHDGAEVALMPPVQGG